MNVRRITGYPGLYREDLGKEGSRYRIVITRNKETTQEYFYFGKGMVEAEAREKAMERWKNIRRSLPVVTRVAFAQIERRKSPSGTVGVRRITQESKGHPYDYWIAVWSDQRRNKKMKKFSVNKYGEEEAKRLAHNARVEGLAHMDGG